MKTVHVLESKVDAPSPRLALTIFLAFLWLGV